MAINYFDIILLYFLIFPIFQYASAENIKPHIKHKYETILSVNETHSILCEGNKPLIWKYPPENVRWISWKKYTHSTVL